MNARPLLHRALNIHFADMFPNGDWHFHHRSFGGQRSQLARGTSVVLARKEGENCKLPLLRGTCACHTCRINWRKNRTVVEHAKIECSTGAGPPKAAARRRWPPKAAAERPPKAAAVPEPGGQNFIYSSLVARTVGCQPVVRREEENRTKFRWG
jgi:hypothetical protein